MTPGVSWKYSTRSEVAAFAGVTGKGRSSPGNANRSIGTQAGDDEGSHSDSQRGDALRHTSSGTPAPGVIPVHTVVAPTPGVIPAQAGILTRDAIYKGHAVTVNYAGKSLKVRIILCLSCCLWCGSGRYVNQDARTLIKIPAFAGMTGERQE